MVYLWLAKTLAGPVIRAVVGFVVASIVLEALGLTIYDVAACFGLLGRFGSQYAHCPV